MKNLIAYTVLCWIFNLGYGATYTVTNNNNAGAGSLRQAITNANGNAGIDRIEFAIPSATQAGRTITLSSALPAITEGVIIDGTTQASTAGTAFGVSNAYIGINDNNRGDTYCFDLATDNCEIYGLYIYGGFSKGIRSWFGSPRGNHIIGAPNKGNVISGNDDGFFFYTGDNVTIQSNIIGLNPDGVTADGNDDDGIFIYYDDDTYTTQIGGTGANEGNVISANGSYGLNIREGVFTVEGNLIGTDYTGTQDLGNDLDGIRISLQTDNSIIRNNTVYGNGDCGINVGGDHIDVGPGNVIASNSDQALEVYGDNNLITQNSMYDNGNGGGIYLIFANNNKNTPVISQNDASGISGTADAGDVIEIFAKDNVAGNCEGMTYQTSVTANGSGNWSATGDYSGCAAYVVTATDANDNTSEFNTCAAPPSAPSYSGATDFCGGSGVSLTASGIGGAVFKWYSDAGLTTLVYTGNPYTGMTATGSIWVTQTTGGCESNALKIDINVTPSSTGSSCSDPHNVTSLPFSQNALTTCGACSDYDRNSPGLDCGGGAYLDDEDYVFAYTPSTNELINISVSNISNWSGLFVFDGCPDNASTNCLDVDTEITGDPSIDGVNLTAGNTYYIVVSTDDYQGCTAFDIDITTCNSPGTSCSTAESVSSLPFYQNSTTCGYCNFYTSSDACGSSYMNGEEHVYTYTPSANQDIMIAMANVNNTTGVFLMDGCPDAVGTSCVGSFSTTSGEGMMSATLTGGQTYYVLVGQSSSNCGTYDLAIIERVPSPPCAGANVDAGDSASTAPLFCSLENFCGNTSATFGEDDKDGTNLDAIFCGSIDNSSWVSFIAKDSVAILQIEVGNCAGIDGIQAMIFQTSDFVTFTAKSNCWNPGVIETGYIVATDLTPGEEYFLMIDGWGGDVCDYSVTVPLGAQLPVSIRDTSICRGDNVTITVSGGDEGVYVWDHGPTASSVNVSPTVTTEYIVTNSSGDVRCDTKDTSVVTVNALPTADMNDASICNGAAANLDISLTGTAPWELTYTTANGANNFNPTSINTSPYSTTVSALGTLEITQIRDSACVNDTNITITIASSGSDDPSFTYANFCEDATGSATITGLAGGDFSFSPDPADGSSIDASTGAISDGVGGSTYTVKYVTNGGCPDSSTVNIGIGTVPNAGLDTTLGLCSNEGVIDLMTYLRGNPIGGGQWKDNNTINQANGNINTLNGSTLNGNHTYTLVGDSGCTDQTSTIALTVNDLPIAGDDNSITICSDLDTLLADYINNYVAGGTWYTPADQVVADGRIDGATDAAGIYYYVQLGAGTCDNDTAFLTVTINPASDAGTGTDTTLCSSEGTIDLNTFLWGTPNAGGNWDYPHTAVNENGQLDLVNGVIGKYTYTVLGGLGCTDDTASIRLTIVDSMEAGTGQTVSICGDSTISLNNYVSNQDAGGIWYDPSDRRLFSGDVITADTAVQGEYYYVVSPSNPCLADTAFVRVNISASPNGGTDLDTILCSNGGNLDLSVLLQGEDNGGTWDYPSGAVNQAGVFDLATETSGAYEYIVLGGLGCPNDTGVINLTINTAVNAGTGGTYDFCSDTTLDLFDLVTGEEAGGTWYDPSNAVMGSTTINTASAATGTYLYIRTAGDSCLHDTATVILNISTAVTAGLDTFVSICASETLIELTDAMIGIAGANDINGYWHYPNMSGNQNGTLMASSYIIGTNNYTYYVQGDPGCKDDTAVLALTVEQIYEAGNGKGIDICNSAIGIDLNSYLSADVNNGLDLGGRWEDPNGGAIVGGIIDGNTAITGEHLYIWDATAPCASDTAFMMVNITTAPDAGSDTNLTLCDGGNVLDLDTIVNPGTIETWKAPDLTTINSLYDPQTDPAGDYLHIVLAGPGCIDDTATVSISKVAGPNAGLDATYADCSNSGSFDMFALLGGSPDAGGRWYNSDTTYRGLAGSTFDPNTDASGDYFYVVGGVAPCDSAMAKLTITISTETNAGIDSVVYACRNEGFINLLDQLAGTPDNHGTWTAPSGVSLIDHNIDVSTADSGIYVYTIPANGTCLAGSTNLRVVINDTAYAGEDYSFSICNGDIYYMNTIYLTDSLGGDPDSIGDVRWITPSGVNLGNGVDEVLLTNMEEGVYTYVSVGALGCNDDYSYLTVDIDTLLEVGNVTLNYYCDIDSTLALIDLLAGSPDQGGTWIDPSGALLGADSVNLSVADSGYYDYAVAPLGACRGDTSMVLVSISEAISAGLDASDQICESIGTIDLDNMRAGSFEDGGVWQVSGTTVGSNIVINSSSIGTVTYEYIVSDATACPSDTSVHVLTIDSIIQMAASTSVTECLSKNEESLFDFLGGNYDTIGYWLNPNRDTIFTDSIKIDTAIAGVYKYIIESNGACAGDSLDLTLSIGSKANAGRDSFAVYCNIDSIISPFNYIGGASNDGRWYNDQANFVGDWNFTDNVLNMDSAEYTYIVLGANGCEDDTALFNVQIHQEVEAGNASFINDCETATISLMDQLSGHDLGGDWYTPDDRLIPSDSARLDTSIVGSYYYVKDGGGICPNDTVSLSVGIGQAGDAGVSDSIIACKVNQNLDLYNELGGSPEDSGRWYNSNNIYLGVWDTNVNALSIDSGTYHYIVEGSFGCANDTSDLLLKIHLPAYAGVDDSAFVCSVDTLYLTDHLLGTPDLGGTWYTPNGDFISNDSIACDTAQMGLYYYVVTGNGTCINDTAFLKVDINNGRNSGNPSSNSYCSSNDPFSLFNLLGAYEVGGTWYSSNVVFDHPTQFDPSMDSAGTYYYVLSGLNGCKDDSTDIDLSIFQAVDAGRDTSIDLCMNTNILNLVDLIENDIDTNGNFWTSLILTGNTFDPATGQSDSVYYILDGTSPCPSDTAVYGIETKAFRSAGIDTSYNVCSNQGTLVLSLNETDPGGVWMYDGDTINPPVVSLEGYETSTSHTFTYVQSNDRPCPSDFGFLNIHLGQYFEQAIDEIPVYHHCQNDGDSNDLRIPIRLNGIDENGIFTSNLLGNIDPVIYHQDTVFSDTIHYIAIGDSGCPVVDYEFHYHVYDKPDLGSATTEYTCYLDSSYTLIDFLGGTPDTFGYWKFNTDTLWDGTFNPYEHTLNGGRGIFSYTYTHHYCGGRATGLTVYFDQPDDPGLDSSYTVCASSAAFSMLPLIGGTPDLNGLWFDEQGLATSASFQPTTDTNRVFTYRVLNNGKACPAMESYLSIEVIDSQVVTINIDSTEGCHPFYVSFSTRDDYIDGTNLSWDFGNGEISELTSVDSVSYILPNIYDVSLSVSTPNCPRSTLRLEDAVIVHETPDAKIQVDEAIKTLNIATFDFENASDPIDSSIYTYLWKFGNGDSIYSPSELIQYEYEDTGVYNVQLIASDDFGCMNVDEMNIAVKAIYIIHFPNAFTPNGDDLNDEFGPIMHRSSIDQYSLQIFNRYGEMVFQSDELEDRWDGTWYNQGEGHEMLQAVYTYVVNIKDVYGKRHEPILGTVLLMR